MFAKTSSQQFIFIKALATFIIGLSACQASTHVTDNSPSLNQKMIRSAHSSWIEEHFQTAIVNIGLEKLGYRVDTPKELDYPALYVSIANGTLDYSTVYYDPGHKQFFDNAGGNEKLARIGTLTPKSLQGYRIDRKTANQYQLYSLAQLKDPKLAKLFDSDGNGKANLAGCNPGWFCEVVIDHHLKAYGLEESVEQDRGNYAALLADAIARYQQGEPILFYAYNPHWIFSILKSDQDVIWLEVPFVDLPQSLGKVSENDVLVEGKNLGFPRNVQRIVANQSFIAKNPVVKRWFELVQIPLEDINAESLRIKKGENRPEEIRRHAQEWVNQNQTQFNTWLEQARAASP